MPGRRAILPSAMFTLVVIAALSSQAGRTTLAADDCLAKPIGPTPQGQHWYYRIDHANNDRQCWRLAPEGLPVQKAAPQAEDANASEPDPQQQPRAPQAVIAASAQTSADAAPAPAANSFVTAPQAPWPATPVLPVLPQSQTVQTANADDNTPVATNDDTPAATSDPAPTGSIHVQRSPRLAPEQPPAAAPQQFAGIDHTFALLMVMFALLAVTGPILHFTHRQRQREEVIAYKPPRWAPVVALNAPAPRVRVTPTPNPAIAYRPARRAAPRTEQTDWRPAPIQNQIQNPDSRLVPISAQRPVPIPAHPPDPHERLRHALQQLVDRIQTIQPNQSDAASGRTRRADVEMLKNAQ
jgi:hypothetical protein